MKIEKDKVFNLKIVDISSNGEGVGKIDDFVIFVKGAITEDFVKVKITKVKKNYVIANLIEVLEKSPFRTNPPCEYYNECGGCNLQHLEYSKQLEFKSLKVKNNIERIGKIKLDNTPEIIGMENPLRYRNKASFHIDFTKKVNIGFYKENSYNIIDIKDCLINNVFNKNIIKAFREFLEETNISIYNTKSKKGLVKHFITRFSKDSKSFIICLVVNSKTFKYSNELINKFKQFENLKGISINFNTSNDNLILSSNSKSIYGVDFIEDSICGLKFQISPLSFYQVNPTQTKLLYEKVLEFASLKNVKTIIDAYCGIGTITLLLAKACEKIYGIDITSSSIQNAKQNAKNNKINNAHFVLGDVENNLNDLIANTSPDLIILDPPRKGCNENILNTISKYKIKNIIYISCDSATLARDLKFLKHQYSIEKLHLVDMFCMTTHVETVCLMSKVTE